VTQQRTTPDAVPGVGITSQWKRDGDVAGIELRLVRAVGLAGGFCALRPDRRQRDAGFPGSRARCEGTRGGLRPREIPAASRVARQRLGPSVSCDQVGTPACRHGAAHYPARPCLGQCVTGARTDDHA
jgi:hypothetical protein